MIWDGFGAILSSEGEGTIVADSPNNLGERRFRRSLLAYDLQVGHENHQNAENPCRRFPFVRRIEEMAALVAEVWPISILGLYDHRLTLGTSNTHIAPSLRNELIQGRSPLTHLVLNHLSVPL